MGQNMSCLIPGNCDYNCFLRTLLEEGHCGTPWKLWCWKKQNRVWGDHKSFDM